MFKRLFQRFLHPRHYWRNISFDELSELYVSMMLRHLALSLVGIFVPIYLWQLGYSLVAILAFFCVFFLSRMLSDLAGGYAVARIGPKHTIAVSYVLQIVALGMLISLAGQAFPLWLIAVVWGSANSLFFIAYHVDFSKVKHTDHGGREIGLMTIMERVGGLLGPLVGGVLAALFGAQYTFLAATVFFVVGLVPLFLTPEPVKTHQKLHFGKLPINSIKRDMVAYAAVMTQHTLSIVLWPLFLVLFVIGTDSSSYAKVGLLASLGAVAALSSAYIIGKSIDMHYGRLVMRMSALLNAVLHLARSLVNSFGAAIGISLFSEAAHTGFRMPFHKGMYDAADGLPGLRIVYIVTVEAFANFAKAWFYGILIFSAQALQMRQVFTLAFTLAGMASCLILVERFAALDMGRKR